jgi:hypothetical protein
MSEPPEASKGGWPLYGPPPEPEPDPEAIASSPAPTATRKRSPALVALAVIGGLIVLFCGGCLAFTDVIITNEDGGSADSGQGLVDPGTADDLVEITPGVAFEVDGMAYAAGWSIQRDDVGDLVLKKLRVTNNRDEPDQLNVEIRLWRGFDLLAQSDCSTDVIPVGATVTPECFSADKVPQAYDYVTINDDF